MASSVFPNGTLPLARKHPISRCSHCNCVHRSTWIFMCRCVHLTIENWSLNKYSQKIICFYSMHAALGPPRKQANRLTEEVLFWKDKPHLREHVRRRSRWGAQKQHVWSMHTWWVELAWDNLIARHKTSSLCHVKACSFTYQHLSHFRWSGTEVFTWKLLMWPAPWDFTLKSTMKLHTIMGIRDTAQWGQLAITGRLHFIWSLIDFTCLVRAHPVSGETQCWRFTLTAHVRDPVAIGWKVTFLLQVSGFQHL